MSDIMMSDNFMSDMIMSDTIYTTSMGRVMSRYPHYRNSHSQLVLFIIEERRELFVTLSLGEERYDDQEDHCNGKRWDDDVLAQLVAGDAEAPLKVGLH